MEYGIRLPDEIRFTHTQVTALLLLVAVSVFPQVIGSEKLTLTTYYPAPYGAYVAMLTTNQTLLARDGGNVGIGVRRPQTKLDVAGTAAATNLQVNGVETESTACLVNGLIARDSEGGLLSCRSHVWKKAGENSVMGGYNLHFHNSDSSDCFLFGIGKYDSGERKFSGRIICSNSGYCGAGPARFCHSDPNCVVLYAATGNNPVSYGDGIVRADPVYVEGVPVFNATKLW